MPLNGGLRPELGPRDRRARSTAPIARYRVYSARQAAAMAGQAAALSRALRADDRAAARRAWAGVYDHWLRVGAAYGSLGDLDAAITDDRRRIERGLWTGESLRRAGARGRTAERRRPQAAADRPDGRDHAAGLRDPRPRDPRGRPARHAQRRRRALERRRRPGHGVLARRHLRRRRHAARAARRARHAGAGASPACRACARELAALQRAHGGRWPTLDELSRTESQRLNGRLGAGLEILAKVPGALETQLPPAIPEIHP